MVWKEGMSNKVRTGSTGVYNDSSGTADNIAVILALQGQVLTKYSAI